MRILVFKEFCIQKIYLLSIDEHKNKVKKHYIQNTFKAKIKL